MEICLKKSGKELYWKKTHLSLNSFIGQKFADKSKNYKLYCSGKQFTEVPQTRPVSIHLLEMHNF